jgi:hypothetical protein
LERNYIWGYGNKRRFECHYATSSWGVLKSLTFRRLDKTACEKGTIAIISNFYASNIIPD